MALRVQALYDAGVDTPVLLPAGAQTGDFAGSLASITELAQRVTGGRR